ncbi:hypothetical protein DGM85_10505 [Xanthomonas phaseoli pv. phaseoli]|nr:hypothetical protein DGM93_10370 [Xanthomonas phaseoli pv. phaseoli]QWN28882.1 hypothetical protein DGM85_10505 [Xanthomonas phaseoli pv. phaseoli]QWN33039.1 hypothetical protein DGM81_10390 [Xanthomonas phaseoli pv. phaseoli]
MPAHRRGTLGGMHAARELTWTYLQRVLRWWAGKALQQARRRRGRTARRRRRRPVHRSHKRRGHRPTQLSGGATEQRGPRPWPAGRLSKRRTPTNATGTCPHTLAGHADEFRQPP